MARCSIITASSCPTYTERLVWTRRRKGRARRRRRYTRRVRVRGGLVCWEHWMPLARQALHESGEDIHVAAWPTVKEMLQVASRHYAFEGAALRSRGRLCSCARRRSRQSSRRIRPS